MKQMTQSQDNTSDATSATTTSAAKGTAGNKITDYMFPTSLATQATPPDASSTVKQGTHTLTAAPSNERAVRKGRKGTDKKGQRLSPGQGGQPKARDNC